MIASIFRSSMQELQTQEPEIYDLIINEAEGGFFETHQSPGSFKRIAEEIRIICSGSNVDHAN